MTDKEFFSIIKKQRYKAAIFSYGIVTLLYLLKEHEQTENYEECQCIIESIQEFNKHWDFKGHGGELPQSLNDINISEFLKEAWANFDMKPDNYLNNLDYYIEKIKQDINSVYDVNGKG